ncbi:hypothetical protein A3K70_03870 [Candidatus Bathyarchaeota archaeon RBG_16_48_13]|nr:MAG: hypothetical protein A3K70_03870 [Candidatus Bathyarchaeota archaeon RBG_16_48_13]
MESEFVIIGGNASGMKAAARARRCNPNLQITVFEKGDYVSFAGCGLPYYISGLIEDSDELIVRSPDWFKEFLDLDVKVNHRVEGINRKARKLVVRDLSTDCILHVTYRKLLIATGANPIKLPIEGASSRGVFTIKSMEDGSNLRDFISERKPRKAVIVGAGLIGLEMAESLLISGLDVSIVEKLEQILPILDDDMAFLVEKYLKNKSIKFFLGESVRAFDEDAKGSISYVETDKRKIAAGLAIISIGVKPEVTLAREAGLEIGETGAIRVNSKMYTCDPNILAAGDCVETVDFVTGRPIWAPLGSTANKQGRVAGENAAGGEVEFGGVAPVQIARLFDLSVAKAGLSEIEARKLDFDIEVTFTNSWDHPQYYPGARIITMKTMVNRPDHRLLGCQIVGERGVDKRIDVMATALYKKMTCDDLSKLDLAYAPPYSPALDSIITAGNVALNKLKGAYVSINGKDLLQRMMRGEDLQLVDVLQPKLYKECHIPKSTNIPLNELWKRSNELDREKEVITICKYGITSYHAARFLKERMSFKDVKSLEGGIIVWQGPTEKSI